MQLTGAAELPWVALILCGSLLEAAYMFRWFTRAVCTQESEPTEMPSAAALFPIVAVALLLCISGYVAARASGAGEPWMFGPLLAGTVLYALDRMPGRVKNVLMLAVVLVVGGLLAQATQGIAWLFAILLLAGSLVIAAAGLYRDDERPGYYPMLAILLLSIQALLRSSTSLEFFFSWEIVTLSTCFLIAKGRGAGPHVLSFLLFSLLSAFLVLAGFAGVAAVSGSTSLNALMTSGPDASIAFVFLAAGFLIKAGAIGVHVWLPGAYSEADDDFTAMLSGVVSKVAVFGLLMGTYLAIRSEVGLELAHAMAWLGMLTTIAGAFMALRQTDFKCLLALSSMSQLGYIVTAIALMSHLGWVTALYLVANHMMVKGILFLAVAGIILRTGTRSFAETGGLARTMPITFGTVLVAIISMSGLPPLMGFGGKWLLLSAMMDKGWHLLAIAGIFATFLGFLYMIRFVGGLFFGPHGKRSGCCRRSADDPAHPTICADRGHRHSLAVSEAAHGARFGRDRPAIRLDPRLGRDVARDDLWLLESGTGHDRRRCGRGDAWPSRSARPSGPPAGRRQSTPVRHPRSACSRSIDALCCRLLLAEHRERCPCRCGLGAEAVLRKRPDLCTVCPVLRPGHLCCRHGACRAVGGRLSVGIDPAWSGPQCRLALPGLPWSWGAGLLRSHAMNLAHRFTSAGLSKCSGTGVGVTRARPPAARSVP